jgi:DNA transposition AAA+ family ATPase
MTVRTAHVAGLVDVPVVRTPLLRMTERQVASAARYGEIILIYGAAGLGKTLAVRHAVEAQTMPHLWVQVGPLPSPKEVVVRLLKEIEGSFPSKGDTLYEMADRLIELLDDQKRIVVLDEAQNFSKAGIDQLRNIHDRSTGFPLILVGGATTNNVIGSDPQLNDRVAGRVAFRPLADTQLIGTLRSYHPYLGDADPTLIFEVNASYARGVFRRWARILKEAVELTGGGGTLDRKTARAVLAKIGGGT